MLKIKLVLIIKLNTGCSTDSLTIVARDCDPSSRFSLLKYMYSSHNIVAILTYM